MDNTSELSFNDLPDDVKKEFFVEEMDKVLDDYIKHNYTSNDVECESLPDGVKLIFENDKIVIIKSSDDVKNVDANNQEVVEDIFNKYISSVEEVNATLDDNIYFMDEDTGKYDIFL